MQQIPNFYSTSGNQKYFKNILSYNLIMKNEIEIADCFTDRIRYMPISICANR